MADIPTYDPQASPRPLPTPYDDARVSPDSFGAAVGEGLQRAGADVEHIARRAKANADATAVLDGETQLLQHYNDSILDEKNGYRSLRGTDAIAASDKTFQDLQTARAKIAAGLSNPEQQRVFMQRSMGMVERGYREIQTHLGQQIQQHSQAVADNRIQAGIDAAVLAARAGSDSDVQANVDNLPGVVRAYATAMKLDPEQTAENLRRVQAKANAAVVQEYLATAQVAKAQTYFEKNRAAIGENHALEQQITTHSDMQGAITDALSIIGDNVRPGTTLFDEQKALAAAGALKVTPERKYKTMELIEQQAGRMKTAQDQKNATIFSSALSVYERTGSLTPTDPKDAATVATAQAYLLDPVNQAGGLWERLRDRARMDMRRDTSDPPTDEERRNAVALRVDIADHPEKYANMTEEQYAAQNFDRLHPKDYTSIGSSLANLQKNVGKMAAATEKVLPDKVDTMLVALGRGSVFPTGKRPTTQWSTSQVELYEKAREGVLSQAAQFVATNAKPPSYADYERFIRTEFVQGTVPHEEPILPGISYTFKDRATRVEFETHPEKFRGKEFVPDIPSDKRAVILDAWRKRGVKAPSEAQIQAAYGAMLPEPTAAPLQTGSNGRPVPQLDTPGDGETP